MQIKFAVVEPFEVDNVFLAKPIFKIKVNNEKLQILMPNTELVPFLKMLFKSCVLLPIIKNLDMIFYTFYVDGNYTPEYSKTVNLSKKQAFLIIFKTQYLNFYRYCRVINY